MLRRFQARERLTPSRCTSLPSLGSLTMPTASQSPRPSRGACGRKPCSQDENASGGWLPGLVDGLTVMPLHEYASPRGAEHAALVRWAPDTHFNEHGHFGGEEIFVLEGEFHDEHGAYPAGSWIRSPHQSRHRPLTREPVALIYMKTGHLLPPA